MNTPDKSAIQKYMNLITVPGNLHEIRMLEGEKGYTRSIFFTSFDDCKKALGPELDDASVAGIYITLNPIDPAHYVKYPMNKVLKGYDTKPLGGTTTDGQILRRHWLLLDVDAKKSSPLLQAAFEQAENLRKHDHEVRTLHGEKLRPFRPSSKNPAKPYMASQSEMEAALARRTVLLNYLTSEGCPEPLVVDTGSGGALLYRIDLPNDAESDKLVGQFLILLKAEFGVDETVVNAARISRVVGTVNRKKQFPDENRLHRTCQFVSVPETVTILTKEKMMEIVDKRTPVDEFDYSTCDVPRSTSTPVNKPKEIIQRPEVLPAQYDRLTDYPIGFDGKQPETVRAYLESYGITIKGESKNRSGHTLFYLDECVCDPSITSESYSDIAVGCKPDGIIYYANRHDRGAGFRWEDVRTALEGAKQQEQTVNDGSDLSMDAPPKGSPDEDYTVAALPDFKLEAKWLDRLPFHVREMATHFAMGTNGKIDSKHVMLAISTWAAIIAKKAKFHNWTSKYYLNMAIVLLAKSGQAKSNLKDIVKAILDGGNIEVADFATATTEGIVDKYAWTVTKNAQINDPLAIEKARLGSARQPGVTLLTDELLALTGGMIRKEESSKYVRMFCKLLDNNGIGSLTKGGGESIWKDQCVNIVASSQTDDFNDALRSTAFKSAGLSGRIVPVNTKMLDWQMTPVDGYDVVGAVQHFKQFESGFDIVFDDEKNGDVLGDAIKVVDELAKGQVPDIYETDWMNIREKILIQGAKVASIFAILDYLHYLRMNASKGCPWAAAGEGRITVNAAKWVTLGMTLVHLCHASNMYFLGVVSEEHDRVKTIISIKGNPTKRDIVRHTHWESYKVENILKDLVAASEIRKISKGKGERYILVKD